MEPFSLPLYNQDREYYIIHYKYNYHKIMTFKLPPIFYPNKSDLLSIFFSAS
jgi:hypothetical protein